MDNFKIILIDDEESQRESIGGFLKNKGYNVTTAASGTEGIEYIRNNQVDMVITDFKMPDKNGKDVLDETKKINPMIPVLIMTAYGSIEGAVNLMQKGAYDYIQKPIELMELVHLIDRAKERHMLMSENEMLKQQLSEKFSFDSIIYQSAEMQEVLNTAGRVAKSKASVLIRGESGTGKELIAKAIHYASDRSDKPFVVVNCAAMPETLFESELFGHEKGAYTGAAKQRIGKFEQADTGTLFIDEVGDIPLQIQVKMLRALQFGQIERLGGSGTIDPDVRIISATNRNLEKMIKDGDFREDLYYRLNVVNIDIPPLRKRREDIPKLIDHFIKKYAEFNGKNVKSASKEALDDLMRYDYPGNVRELENLIQRSVVLTRDKYIKKEDLPDISDTDKDYNEQIDFDEVEVGDLNDKIKKMESALITKALEKANGNQVKAADMLNISERTLRYKISKYKIR